MVGVWYVGSFTFSRLICTNCRFSIYYNKEEELYHITLTSHLHMVNFQCVWCDVCCGVDVVFDGGAVSTDKVREACSSW